jgi:hypothetical protein
VGCRNRCVIVPVDVRHYPAGTAAHLEAFEAKMQEPGIPRPRAIILCVSRGLRKIQMSLVVVHRTLTIVSSSLIETARAIIDAALGYCFDRESIVAYCKFAEKHDLHLIVDESESDVVLRAMLIERQSTRYLCSTRRAKAMLFLSPPSCPST